MTTSQDSSTISTSATTEKIMSLQDNRYNSNMEPNSMNSMEDLRQQLKGSELNNMKLSLENQALQEVERELKSKLKKMDRMLVMKENHDRERDEVIHTFQSVNTALVDKNGELMDKLRTAQNLIHNNCTGNLTVTDQSKLWTSNSENVICSERIKELESLVETSDLKVHTLEVQLRREQVEKDTCLQKIKELKSLVEATEKKWLNVQEDLRQNVELRAKLSTAQTQIHDGQTACYRKVDFIEGLVLRYSVCSKRTKELESLVEATEKKWLNVQEDLRKNVELRAKLSTAQTQIRDGKTAFNRKVNFIEGLVLRYSVCSKRIKELESLVETSDLKVNTLEDQLRSEKVEKETCLQRTKELESLVEATEKKWLNVQEDSQHKVQKMEEDIKFLIVKSIKLQELALMSDSDKARRSEEARQIQKKQKIEKVQREMKLKERDKQEKKKQQKIAKELIEKMRSRKSMGR